jgi:hypothetical protein
MKMEWKVTTNFLASNIRWVHFNAKFEGVWFTVTAHYWFRFCSSGWVFMLWSSGLWQPERKEGGSLQGQDRHFLFMQYSLYLGPQKKGPTSHFPLLFVRAPRTAFLAISCPSYNITIQVTNKGCFLLHLLLNIPIGLYWTLSHGSKSLSSVLSAYVTWPNPHCTQFNPEDGNSMSVYTYNNCMVSWSRGLHILTTLYFLITWVFVDTWACRHNITCSTTWNIAEVRYILNHDYWMQGSSLVREGKVVPVLNLAQHHEDVWGSGSTAPCVQNVSNQLHILAAILLGRSPQRRSGCDGKGKNQCSCQEWTPFIQS